ncbi:hypothetical protein [Hansschlegelia zhihuaiae]|uniref:Uncharacterized protein n=1 Tax=Hansschlegelia zhihuaiae TaxID=405005 RepID=A0A4Q0MC85_9HYPH|nr:hypothetical protein [Hansschlegelia zhihuaiae]RXF70804.1 hypothetical protein EK403_16630 [Hansschlegelia zhihuaiae]
MSVMRAFVVPSIATLTLLASVGLAMSQSSGGGSSSGGSSAGGAAGSPGSASRGSSLSTPTYSAMPPAGTAASGGVATGRSAGSADIEPYPEHGGRTIRCPDGSVGKTDAGGCLGGPTPRY